MFGFGKRTCKECGTELGDMEALADRADDLIRSSALGSATPISNICARCRVALTKSAPSLGMNLHVIEARRVEAKKAADAAQADGASVPSSAIASAPAERAVAQVTRGATAEPAANYQPGGGHTTEEGKEALLDAPSFDQIANFPDLFWWLIGTNAGRQTAVALFFLMVMIFNAIGEKEDYPPMVPELAIEESEPPTPDAASPPAPVATAPAQPANDPGNWVTTLDYPNGALNDGAEGTTAFRLTVDAPGRVTECVVTLSSGHADLDEAACSAISRRARFEAAADGTAARSYRNRVRWRIPG